MSRIKTFQLFLIGGGIFNILVSSLYILPWGALMNLEVLSWLHTALMLKGTPPAAVLPQGLQMLYLNGFGIVDVTVGILLIYNARDIVNRSAIAFFDAVARFVFALLMIEAVLYEHISSIALFFALIEIFLALAYMKYIYALKLKVW